MSRRGSTPSFSPRTSSRPGSPGIRQGRSGNPGCLRRAAQSTYWRARCRPSRAGLSPLGINDTDMLVPGKHRQYGPYPVSRAKEHFQQVLAPFRPFRPGIKRLLGVDFADIVVFPQLRAKIDQKGAISRPRFSTILISSFSTRGSCWALLKISSRAASSVKDISRSYL